MKYLFHGKDKFLSLREAKNLAKQIKGKNPSMEYFVVDAQSCNPQIIINHLSSDDMFGKSKIVLFKRFFQNKQKEDLMKFLLGCALDDERNVYIFWEESKISSITKYFKFFKKNVVELDKKNKPAFVKWAMEELGENKIYASRDIVYEFAQRINYETERFVMELEKLKALGIEKIDIGVLKENTSDTYESDIWKLISAINTSNQDTAISIFSNLQKNLVDPNYILAMLSRNLRLLTLVKYLDEKGTERKEICKTAGIAPFAVFEILDCGKRTSWEKISFLYEKFTNLDYEIKRGGIEASLGITLLLTKI